MNADANAQRHEGTEFDMVLEPAGVLRLTWPRGATISESDAEAAMRQVNLLCGEDNHPMLVDMATTAEVSRGARAVWARPCQASRIALLGASPVDRVIANFFLGIYKAPCPTKFFTSEREALEWLGAG